MMLQKRRIHTVYVCGIFSMGLLSVAHNATASLPGAAVLGGIAAATTASARSDASISTSINRYGYLTLLKRAFALQALTPYSTPFHSWLNTQRAAVDSRAGTGTVSLLIRAACYYLVDYLLHTKYRTQPVAFIASHLSPKADKSARFKEFASVVNELIARPISYGLGHILLPKEYVIECMSLAPIVHVWYTMATNALKKTASNP